MSWESLPLEVKRFISFVKDAESTFMTVMTSKGISSFPELQPRKTKYHKVFLKRQLKAIISHVLIPTGTSVYLCKYSCYQENHMVDSKVKRRWVTSTANVLKPKYQYFVQFYVFDRCLHIKFFYKPLWERIAYKGELSFSIDECRRVYASEPVEPLDETVYINRASVCLANLIDGKCGCKEIENE